MKKYILSSKLSNKIEAEIIGKLINIPMDFREAFLDGLYLGFVKSGNIRLADFVQELADVVMLNDTSVDSQNAAIREWAESDVK